MSNINADPRVNLTGARFPPGKLTNTVATAATPSSAKKNTNVLIILENLHIKTFKDVISTF